MRENNHCQEIEFRIDKELSAGCKEAIIALVTITDTHILNRANLYLVEEAIY